MSYKHILVATDLHSDDLPVVRKAVELTKLTNAKLTIINVVPNVPYYMASGLSSISDVEDRLEKEARAKLEWVKTQINIEAEFNLTSGSARAEIVKLANKINADLIVIGSHGHSGVQRLVGSTTSSVLNQANCDVLVVRIKN